MSNKNFKFQMKIFNLVRLATLLTTLQDQVLFLQQYDVLPCSKVCPKCGEDCSKIGKGSFQK